jgi:hypothetical protein
MIAVKLEGRLGNQLFQYAFIYVAAKKLGTSFYTDKSIDYLLIDKYFDIQPDFCGIPDNKVFSIKGYKNIFSHRLRRAFYYSLRNILRLKRETFSNFEPPEQQLKKIKNGLLYEGFFQSEMYFADYKDDIKKLFSIKDIHRGDFETVFNTLPRAERYIAVHIRRGDYIDYDLAPPLSYYHAAISNTNQKGNYYIFVSDDSDFVESEFAYITNKYISRNDEITDLQFLMHADICILSNSTFSWWGAWLNDKKDKIVHAPRYFLGWKTQKEFPENIYPSTWNLISV